MGFNSALGYIVIDNASGGTDPRNGDKQILVQLDDRQGTDLSDGDWTIRIQGGSGEVHAWKIFSTMTTGFPGSDQTYSVGIPGTAQGAVTLGAEKTRQSWPSIEGTASYGTGNSWGDAAEGDLAPLLVGGTHPGRPAETRPDGAGYGHRLGALDQHRPAPARQPSGSGGATTGCPRAPAWPRPSPRGWWP